MAQDNCSEALKNYVPSSTEYFENFGLGGIVVFVSASLALLIIVGLFVDNLLHAWHNFQSKYVCPSGIVLSSYPVVGLCMYLQIVFPRSSFILDSCAYLWFVVCMYQFFQLTIAYFGGEASFVKSFEGDVLPWRGVPCCFWPCVWPCLPKETVNKNQVLMLRLLILQHPVIQAVLTLIGAVIYVDDLYDSSNEMFARTTSRYIFQAGNVSFLFALWAFVVSFRAAKTKLTKFKYGGKVISFQLSLILFRIQPTLFSLVLIPFGVIPCVPPLSPQILGTMMLSSLLLGQLVIFSVMANHFYKTSLADRTDFIL